MIISLKLPPKISMAVCRAAAFSLSLRIGTLSNSLPILLSSRSSTSFLMIFSTIRGTHEISFGLISAKDCAIILGEGIRVRK